MYSEANQTKDHLHLLLALMQQLDLLLMLWQAWT